MTAPDLLPGEYADPRMHRARARFNADEWMVLLARFEDAAGPATWSEAALAAGKTPELGERVRRKIPRVRAEVERRSSAPSRRR